MPLATRIDDPNQGQSFLRGFGQVLLDGLQAGTALVLQREFLPANDQLFTATPTGGAPAGQPASTRRPVGDSSDAASLLVLGVIGFLVFKAVT